MIVFIPKYIKTTMSYDTLVFPVPVTYSVARRTVNQLTGFCCPGYHPLDSAIYSTSSAALSSISTLLNWFSLYIIMIGLTTHYLRARRCCQIRT
ncbi:hypothetical protein SAMN05428987_1216 [Paenibacillus sp. CF095]|nr:hypothetical protein SAMN05428987_1216 [Paenibacillus sp. CF095]